LARAAARAALSSPSRPPGALSRAVMSRL
jgi:hypothetical protein